MSGPDPSVSPAVALRGVTVRYGAVTANREVSLEARAGEVHALVGENGAGKSTLMRALFGLTPLSAGEVWVGGERVARPSPERMIALGLGMVHQHFMLVPPLTVAENVVLGDEPCRPGWPPGRLDRPRAEREVEELAARHGMAVDPRAEVASLSVGQQQRVEILKALRRRARVLILDEPTAVLTPPEVAELLALLRGFARGGGTVLLVTHKLDEVQAVADRVTVLRRGEVVERFERGASGLSPAAIARAMVGRDLLPPPASPATPPGEPRLVVEGLVAGRLGREQPVSFTVRRGEILGVAGVEGNGQHELLAALSGVLPCERGTIRLDGTAGEDVSREGPAARRARGLGCVPDDRHRLGLLLDAPLADNLLLGREVRFARWFGLDRRALLEDSARLLAEHDVRPPDPSRPARSLSGGNQQKAILARELSRSPSLLLCAQPTRGVDVGAIEQIHRRLDEVRGRGGAVLLISAELDELLALADRIAVLYRGRLVAVVPRAQATAERLGALMTGLGADEGAA